MAKSQIQIRHADGSDAVAVAALAGELAQSFAFSRAKFDLSFPALLAAADVCLLAAIDGDDRVGYLLGFGTSRSMRTDRSAGCRSSWSAPPAKGAASAGR